MLVKNGLSARIWKKSQWTGFLSQARMPAEADDMAKILLKGFAVGMTHRNGGYWRPIQTLAETRN
jgi:hypothetical protein